MKKKLSSVYWYIFLFIYIEIGYKIFVFNSFINISILPVIIFSTLFALFCYLLTSMFKEKTNKVLCNIISLIFIIYIAAQIIYFKFYGSMFSLLSLIKGGVQATGFIETIMKITFNNYLVLIYYFIIIILYFIIKNKIFDFNKKTFTNNKIFFIIFVSLFVFKMFFVNVFNDYKKIYYDTYNPMITINKMGFYSMQMLDIKRMIFGFKDTFYYEKECDYDVEKSNVLNLNFKNDDISKYIKSVCPTLKNEYTGMFKDKNLIFITAESFDDSLIDEKLTPTLYKLKNEGVIFNNYYQPLYPVSTSDGEYMLLSSLYPAEGKWSLEYSSNDYMPYMLGNMFNYSTSYAYHNGDYNFYKRYLSHTNAGFKFKACNNSLDDKMNCNIWPASDYEMFKATTDDYINEDKFIVYYITVSGHLSYSDNNKMSVKNQDAVKNLNYSDEVKGYIASNLELEYAVKYLMDTLEENGKLDDTLIVISPDHKPYGLLDKELNEISSYDVSDKFESHRTSLIFYNPMLKNIVVDDYISSIDVLPTIYNLFGIEYDSRLLMGKDIFSDEEKIVVLTDRSFITSKGKYDSISNKFTPFVSDVPNNYAKDTKKIIDNKISASRYLLINNYYKELLNDKN